MRRSGLSFALCLALLTVVLPGCSSGSSDTEGAVRPDDKGTAKAGDGNLKTEDLKVGTGKTAEAGDYAVVHYTGWLTDGTKFDSSVDRQQPYRFRIGKDNVIRGWHLGVEGMREGGKRKLTIPPELAYGKPGRPPTIPPNATLVFEIDLLKVE